MTCLFYDIGLNNRLAIQHTEHKKANAP